MLLFVIFNELLPSRFHQYFGSTIFTAVKDKWIIALLLAAQTILCFSVVNQFPISLDEPFSIFHSQQSLSELLAIFETSNNSPLHFVLLHFWIKLFGISPLAVRSLSIVISLLTIVVLYKFGRRFWQKEFAVLLVGLFIFSRLNHYVALEARMYGLFSLFFVLILRDLHQLLTTNKRVFIQLALWNVLLMYTHYLGGVVVVLEVILFLVYIKRWNNTRILQVVLSGVIALILFFPGLQLFFNRSLNFASAGTWVSSPGIIDLWINFVKLFNNQFTLIAVGLLLAGFMILTKKQTGKLNWAKHTLVYFGGWFLAGYGLIFLISITVQPLFLAKYLQFLTIPLSFVLVSIIAELKISWKSRLVSFIFLIPFALSFKPVPNVDRETDVMLAAIKKNKAQNTVVFYCPPHYNLTLAYHYNRSVFADYGQTTERMEDKGFIPIYSAFDIQDNPPNSNFIYADFNATFLYPNNNILNYLDTAFVFDKVASYSGDFNVYYYRTKP